MDNQHFKQEQDAYLQVLTQYQENPSLETCAAVAEEANDLELWEISLEYAEQALGLATESDKNSATYVQMLFRIAILQAELGTQQAYFEQLTQLAQNYKSSTDPDVLFIVCKAFINSALFYAKQEDYEQEIAYYDELLSHIGSRDEEILQEPIARALTFRLESYYRLKQYDVQIAESEVFFKRFLDTEIEAIASHVNSAFFYLGDAYEETENYAQGIANYEANKAFLERFPALKEIEMTSLLFRQAYLYRLDEQWSQAEDLLSQAIALNEQETEEHQVSWAIGVYNKAMMFNAQNKRDEELAEYNLMIERLWDNHHPRVENRLAFAIFNKALVMDKYAQHDAEIECYNQLLMRFAASEDEYVGYKVTHALLNKGYTCHAVNDYVQGRHAFEQNLEYLATKDFPFCAEYKAKSLLGLGLSHYHLDEFKEELTCYQQIIDQYSEADDDDIKLVVIQAIMNMASTYDQQGYVEKEIACYEQAWEYGKDSDNLSLVRFALRAMLNKGITLTNQGQHFSSMQCYDSLLELAVTMDVPAINTIFGQAVLNKARACKNRNFQAEELRTLELLTNRFTDTDDLDVLEQLMSAYLNLGLIYDSLGQHQAELNCYQKIMSFYETHQQPDNLAGLTGQAMYNGQITLRQLGQKEQEAKLCEQFIQYFSHTMNEKLRDQLRSTYFRLAELSLYLQRSSQALNIYQHILSDGFLEGVALDDEVRFDLMKARFNQASILVMQQNPAGLAACESFIERYSYDSDNSNRIQQIRFNLGLSLKNQGQLQEAIAVFDKLINDQQETFATVVQQQAAKAFFAKAECLAEQGLNIEQLELCDQFLARFENSLDTVVQAQTAQVLLNKAVLLSETGAFEQALALYQEIEQRFALEEEPELIQAVARALLNKSLCYLQLSDVEKAEDCLEQLQEKYAYQASLSNILAQAQMVQSQLSEQRIVH
ncbi:tetratricopeptide repeat protein [Pseudomonas sp. F1_0610]|uniref:tetratricopeptide repeat protein n=1 Tax=Pseudomonas sp. F1_0610 TaxID=3114284 RepID=UPI0039C01AEF